MAKKEQAAMEDLRTELRIAKAMRFTENVLPDIMPPDHGLAKGFLFNDYFQRPEVVPACTNSVHHGYGQDDHTSTQGSRRLYSTRLRALRGLRHALEREVAKKLADIDLQIEEELAKS